MKRFNALNQSLKPSRLAAALSLAAMVSVGCSSEAEPTLPDVNAAVVHQELEGQSNEYAYAYGIGLVTGCNPELLLDDNGQLTADARASYQRIFESSPQRAEAGFRTGLERGLLEKENADSEVCQ